MTTRDRYDVSLHLLDRQIVGADDHLVAKVDDVELTWLSDGTLVPTALLVGLSVLLPRLSGVLARTHQLMRAAAADRDLPLVVDLGLVDEVGSDVRLNVVAHARLPRMDRARADDPRRSRVGDLLGIPVRCAALPRRSKVLDLCVVGAPGRAGRDAPHEVAALIVGPGRPGALLGYDRRSEPGPAAVAALVRWLHRHARVVDLGPGVTIDRDAGEVRIASGTSLLPLRG